MGVGHHEYNDWFAAEHEEAFAMALEEIDKIDESLHENAPLFNGAFSYRQRDRIARHRVSNP